MQCHCSNTYQSMSKGSRITLSNHCVLLAFHNVFFLCHSLLATRYFLSAFFYHFEVASTTCNFLGLQWTQKWILGTPTRSMSTFVQLAEPGSISGEQKENENIVFRIIFAGKQRDIFPIIIMTLETSLWSVIVMSLVVCMLRRCFLCGYKL